MRPLIVCCIISLLLLTFYLREGESGPVHAVRSGVTFITSPVRIVGSAVATPFNALGNVFSNVTAPQSTLSELRSENEELRAELAKLSEAQATAERLENLVGLKSTYKLTSKAANIIGTDADSWSKTVTLNRGSIDGFASGMAVCNSGGVIGQIIEVSPSTSTVRLIGDENSGVSAMIQATRAQGMLQGQPDGSLRLEYVPVDADVSTGDTVVTSGLGGVFPKGLPLGTVTAVDRSPNSTYYSIVVRPHATTESNEEVLVVTSITDDQVASADEVKSANQAPEGGDKSDSGE